MSSRKKKRVSMTRRGVILEDWDMAMIVRRQVERSRNVYLSIVN